MRHIFLFVATVSVAPLQMFLFSKQIFSSHPSQANWVLTKILDSPEIASKRATETTIGKLLVWVCLVALAVRVTERCFKNKAEETGVKKTINNYLMPFVSSSCYSQRKIEGYNISI